jgi:NTE family protein
LALSGGGAKAAAHLGVMRVLDLMGLKIDLVAGTSGGALAGVFHCDGHSPDRSFEILQQSLMAKRWWHRFPGARYWQLARHFRQQTLATTMEGHLRAKTFADLKTPLFVTATDLVTGESVVLDRGELSPAVMASMSLPGFAPPVAIGNRLLVDGGVLNNLPINAILRHGADIIIAVDLGSCNAPSGEWARWRPNRGSVDVLRRAWDIQNRELTRRRLAAADVVIRPQVGEFGIADMGRMGELMRLGEEAAVQSIPLIRDALEAWDGSGMMVADFDDLSETAMLRRRGEAIARRQRAIAN